MDSSARTIELLAPARDLEAAVAAVDYGADALYMGGARFGARHAAGNSVETIARVVEYAHQYGVRVHATLNTLLYDDELEAAERQARELIAAGVDALIVQDPAFRRMNLPVELHASTQMCNRTPEQTRFLERCGYARVILERALSLDEIRAIRAASGVELECFVHGAICVGYSGRCFLSRSMSERSGNRGACSQPCRLPYDLKDGEGRTIVRGRHLLSVRDLNLSARLGELIDAGISSFKIEGRLKEVGYIKNVVAHYRREIDRALRTRPGFRRASEGESVPDFRPDPAKSFTRGESEYFFYGRRCGGDSFYTPKAVGEPLGRIAEVGRGWFRLEKPADLAPGDGLCFLTPAGLAGTNVNAVEGGRIVPNRMEGIVPGAGAFRNFDRRFSLRLERSRTRRVIPVRAEAEVAADRIAVRFTDGSGLTVEVVRGGEFPMAKDERKMEETLAAQLARSGETIFEVREVSVACGGRFVPVSLVAELRREGLERLRRMRIERPLERRILPEECGVPFPKERLAAEENVTNRLAEAFWRDHGVRRIERGLDLERSTLGHEVMRSAYCIRRELGECLRERPTLRGDLFLKHGTHRYRLVFDCPRCEMALVDAGERRR
ncbi:MAG: U32 family peptidase [Alistipes sp.]|nr:U32 family peptidase [Alistipes sp.]